MPARTAESYSARLLTSVLHSLTQSCLRRVLRVWVCLAHVLRMSCACLAHVLRAWVCLARVLRTSCVFGVCLARVSCARRALGFFLNSLISSSTSSLWTFSRACSAPSTMGRSSRAAATKVLILLTPWGSCPYLPQCPYLGSSALQGCALIGRLPVHRAL